MICFMLIGFPVAFSLAAVGLFFGALGILTGHFEPSFMQALPLRFHGIISNDLLLAIPFFTFMGAILERCGLAEDLLEGTGKGLRHVKIRSLAEADRPPLRALVIAALALRRRGATPRSA